MGNIRALISKLKAVTIESQEADLLKIVEQHAEIIVDMNTGQLMAGVDSNGDSLGEYRSESYAMMKRFLNPRGVVDLKLTGAFHNSFYIETNKFPVVFNATDLKTGKLAEAYGENIFGLTEENKINLYNDYLKEKIIEYYRKLLQL